MNSLYLFNPENDLALASDSPHFTPPKAATALARAAACLPMWYACRGDYVLAGDETREWAQQVNDVWDTGVWVSTCAPEGVTALSPWGWSRLTREIFRSAGVADRLLPSDALLDGYRRCSHRRITIGMYDFLCRDKLPYPLPFQPIEITDVADVEAALRRGEQLFLKSPLSGSGRGVIDTTTMPERQVLRLARGVIGHQGSIMAECKLEKLADFAMLYDVDGHGVSFAGYSLFFNAGYASYGGNMLLDDDEIVGRLCAEGVDREWLDATREAVSDALWYCLKGYYAGPVGVDMMLYRDGGQVLVAPCVEVNLRMTMGRVAHIVNERYMMPGVGGIMEIVRHPQEAEQSNGIIVDKRLVRGNVFMTPPSGNDFAIVMRTL